MEAMKGGRVGVGEEHDMGDGMQCSDHPYRNNPGGICAFCLQDKLGKLVSSSFPLPIRAPSSSSSSPSFRSDLPPSSSSTTLPSITPLPPTSAPAPSSSLSNPTPVSHYNQYYSRRTRLPFLLPKKKKKKPTSSPTSDNILLKRSKSTATPRSNRSLVDHHHHHHHHDLVIGPFSPRKRNGFWSFLYLSSKSSKKLNSKSFRDINSNSTPSISAINLAPGSTSSAKLKEKCCSGSSLKTDIVVEQDYNNSNSNSPNTVSASSFERKVSRSKSVGCGSRSFSGDFFERISTGFGDCTLRRVESQREGKPKGTAGGGASAAVNRAGEHHHHHCMKERVRCGGLFSGFMMTSSSSSSSSSSYWVSSSADAASASAVNGKSATVALSHNRGRSWAWAFASPMRAFSGKPSSKESNRRDIIRDANDKNATPSLSAIPSLLAVRG